MLRILVSAYACAPNYGTEPGNGWNWAVHLAERGMAVQVLAEQGARPAIEAYLREHPEVPVRFTFVQARPVWLTRSSAPRYVLWQWAALKAARRLMAAETFDLAHHVTFGSVHVPTLLGRLGIPVVFGPVGGGNTAHPALLSDFGASELKERARTLSVRLLALSPLHRAAYRSAGALLGTNLETLRVFRSMGRADAELFLDAGLPASFFADRARSFAERDGPLRILWVGRLLARKGLPLALDALARVRTPFTLTILGGGMEAGTVQAMLRARGLEDRVSWTGSRVPWEKVRAAYLSHDVLLFTSLRDSFGAQLLEAMACGLPVVCLDTSGARDFVPASAAIKVPVHMRQQVVRDLASAIENYAEAPAAMRSRMSEAALRTAREHTWRKRAAHAEQLYLRLLGREQPPTNRTRKGPTMNEAQQAMLALEAKLDGIAEVLRPGSRVIYIDYPLHRNIGDLLINQGTEAFFSRHRIAVKRRYNLHDLPAVLRGVEPDDVFVFHGGGNLGDLYPEHLDAMAGVMRQFPRHQIVQMPQTVYFASDRAREQRCRLLKEHPALTVFVRDGRSLAALRECGVERVHLMPDMAHQLYSGLRADPAEPVDPALYFFRRDPEGAGIPEAIAGHAREGVDWDDCMRMSDRLACALLSRFVLRTRKLGRAADVAQPWYRVRDNLVRSGVAMLSRPRVIYTNRLHAMLLGLLLGRQVRWFDNSYGKLSGYAEAWLANHPDLGPVGVSPVDMPERELVR